MSSHPEDHAASAHPTQPMPATSDPHQRQNPVMTEHHDDHIDVRDPTVTRSHGEDGYDRDGGYDRGRGPEDDKPSPVDEAVSTLRTTDNRTKLLMAIAAMVAITMLMTLALLLQRLGEGGPDPVLVDGVPCLVEDGPEDTAVLYCQR
ncbi:hypothetical protein BH23ACT9_BH23ACT9_31250 [soil metagenome]